MACRHSVSFFARGAAQKRAEARAGKLGEWSCTGNSSRHSHHLILPERELGNCTAAEVDENRALAV